ncbi:glycosyltransferase family 2 protein [Nocardioides sp. Y6]|uniref:Glycosyltransferase family 2 protein n=1 Tax=Nocardioides malaquae TaxID=2773426 RepID=A0ABR9RPK4_9ACTN|nr:glycosyltransferase family 2 protein [Nocardioides malaquae]MBE7323483.1 glycosyltransferase family 2 protein [Nocardioides malaquae]
MRFSVSTVKDTADNVDFFVRANLASGIDHMFVLLDAPSQPGQDEVAEMLGAHRNVTCLRAGRSWWVSGRPSKLNVRQRINANWVRELLAPLDFAEWLFHIDGDEVVRIDDDALAAVPAEASTVALRPLESVSELEPESPRPTRFKRLLDEEELNLLHVLGVVDEPSNQHYFHGHVLGKVGVRPSAPVALALHNAIATDGHPVHLHADERLSLLHYDAVSGAQFVRKWEALATAGEPRFRASRMPAARALTLLVNSDLAPEVRADYLRRIYESTVADDIATLSDLGLLVDVDPLASPRTPTKFPAGGRKAMAARMREMRPLEKRDYYVADPKIVVPFGRRVRQQARRVLRGDGAPHPEVEDLD